MSQNDLVLPHSGREEAEAPRPTQYHARHKRDTETLREKHARGGAQKRKWNPLYFQLFNFNMEWSDYGFEAVNGFCDEFIPLSVKYILSSVNGHSLSSALLSHTHLFRSLNNSQLAKKIDIVGNIEVQLHEVMQAT